MYTVRIIEVMGKTIWHIDYGDPDIIEGKQYEWTMEEIVAQIDKDPSMKHCMWGWTPMEIFCPFFDHCRTKLRSLTIGLAPGVLPGIGTMFPNVTQLELSEKYYRSPLEWKAWLQAVIDGQFPALDQLELANYNNTKPIDPAIVMEIIRLLRQIKVPIYFNWSEQPEWAPKIKWFVKPYNRTVWIVDEAFMEGKLVVFLYCFPELRFEWVLLQPWLFY